MISRPILLFIDDAALLTSIEFALSVAGYKVAAGTDMSDPAAAAALVVDQDCAHGLELLTVLRSRCTTPAILLATNATRALRAHAAEVGAIIVDKPLPEDEPTRTLNQILESHEATA